MRPIKAGSTDQTIYVKIQNSSVTTGAGLTGLVYNSSSLTCYYVKNRGSATQLTLATLAAANSAHSDGGFKEVDATNMPGIYRLDLSDTIVDTAGDVVILLKGATNMVECQIEIPLYAVDPYDATAYGLSRLDAAVTSRLAPTTAGRTLDVSTGGEAGLDWANIGSPTTTVNLSGTTVKTATDVETDTQDIQGRLPAGLISGRIDARVGAMATDVLDAAALKADAVAEIQLGLSTLDATDVADAVWLADITDYQATPDSTAEMLANVGGLSGDIAAVQTSVDAIGDNVVLVLIDTGAIKTKTDQLTFTVPNQVDANAESMNAAAILGNGTSGNLWRGS